MVKIVASDMDGTLLDSQKNFPKEMDYVLEKLNEKMENAHPKLKKISNYHAKSNDENGVMEVIKSYFKI